jgi:FkbM family methyltransferase
MRRALKESVRRILPATLRPHSILAGPLRGASIYTSWHDYPGAILGTTEKPLLDWFSNNVSPGETWIDVGAHYGYTAIALCQLVGPAGRIVAFEPVLTTAGCVARTRELNRLRQLHVVPLALGANVSLETRRLPTVRGMADSTIAAGAWEEEMPVVSFDTAWNVLCEASPEVHGVKIDVQGMELDVIEGMRHTLRRYKPKVIVEFHTGVDRRSIISLLVGCGYREMGDPIEPESSGPSSYADDKSYAFLPEIGRPLPNFDFAN